MKIVLILLSLFLTGCSNGIFTEKKLTTDEIMKKSRDLYDEADKMVGMIDPAFSKNVLVIVSWDSAGTRQRFITHTDKFSLDILKRIK